MGKYLFTFGMPLGFYQNPTSYSSVVLRTSPAFFVFTSSIIDQGGRSLGSHPVYLGPWCRRSSICVSFFMSGLRFGSSHGVAVWGRYDRSAERRLR